MPGTDARATARGRVAAVAAESARCAAIAAHARPRVRLATARAVLLGLRAELAAVRVRVAGATRRALVLAKLPGAGPQAAAARSTGQSSNRDQHATANRHGNGGGARSGKGTTHRAAPAARPAAEHADARPAHNALLPRISTASALGRLVLEKIETDGSVAAARDAMLAAHSVPPPL